MYMFRTRRHLFRKTVVTNKRTVWIYAYMCGRLRLKCDGTRAETRFLLSAKRTSPFKSAEASVQSTTGSRGVRISCGNARYTMFRSSVKSTGYTLHSPFSPFTSPPGRHRVPSHFNWTLYPVLSRYGFDGIAIKGVIKYVNMFVI